MSGIAPPSAACSMPNDWHLALDNKTGHNVCTTANASCFILPTWNFWSQCWHLNTAVACMHLCANFAPCGRQPGQQISLRHCSYSLWGVCLTLSLTASTCKHDRSQQELYVTCFVLVCQHMTSLPEVCLHFGKLDLFCTDILSYTTREI